MQRNNLRFDLSNYLIHFFRQIDTSDESEVSLPAAFGWANIHEDSNLSPLFLLRCAVRHCHLLATWAPRGQVRTIYGPDPAVCFTEMPIAAFLEAGEARWANGEAMSPYGLAFPKNALFARGANPVIYGLDQRDQRIPRGIGGGPRIIPPDVLPIPEQYRYVTYNHGRIDWTHEREWRWPFRGEQTDPEFDCYTEDLSQMPGLSLIGSDLNGMGVIVRTSEEAKWLTHDILSLVDRGVINSAQYSWVLSADSVPAASYIRDPNETAAALSNAAIDLSPYYSMPESEAEQLLDEFSEIVLTVERDSAPPTGGEIGGCWLWLLDNTHPLTRALLMQNRVWVSKTGRYVAWLPEYDDSRGLRERENMTIKLAQLIQARFGIECGYFSVLCQDDPDALPFYASSHLDCSLYYNLAWEGLRE